MRQRLSGPGGCACSAAKPAAPATKKTGTAAKAKTGVKPSPKQPAKPESKEKNVSTATATKAEKANGAWPMTKPAAT